MSEPRFWLLPVHGGSPIELTKPLTLVGRQDDCDLALDHRTISKIHCILMRSDGALLIRDLGSTNGCRVNGQKSKSGAVLPNDVLSIAVFDFRLYVGMTAPGQSAPPSDKTEMIDLSQLAALDGAAEKQDSSVRRQSERSTKDDRGGAGGYKLRE